MKLSKRQKEIISQSVAEIVRSAGEPFRDGKRPSAKQLKKLAVGAAKAMSAGFAAIGKSS